MPRYDYKPFAYRRPAELDGGPASPVPVIVVGAGPVGLAAAIDLALHGVRSVVVDDNNVVSVGSRAICWSKRTLEIFDRLGVAERMVAKGVTWKVGRLFHGEREIYSFDLLPEPGHKMPAFINLQQYYVEQYLVERCQDFPALIDLRWNNRLIGVTQQPDGVEVELETPDGTYTLLADYLLACDGAKSDVRALMGLELEGADFDERFLIADVEMAADFPSERWFWFEPPFHSGQSALLHKQPDNIYRIDLQLGPDADAEAERRRQRVLPRIEAVVGDRPFELDWVSVYSFRCARLEKFVHGRIIFAGDSAHIVSPFGARGGNSGIQDIDNLVWKLAAVIDGSAAPGLVESYDRERLQAADENILNSARATSFMTPKSENERCFRDAVLRLASRTGFARKMVNSGRLSVACAYRQGGPPDELPADVRPGAAAVDAPLGDDWLLNRVGNGFCLVAIGDLEVSRHTLPADVELVQVPVTDMVRKRYLGAADKAAYLIRPDQHVAGRWIDFDPSAIDAVLRQWLQAGVPDIQEQVADA